MLAEELTGYARKKLGGRKVEELELWKVGGSFFFLYNAYRNDKYTYGFFVGSFENKPAFAFLIKEEKNILGVVEINNRYFLLDGKEVSEDEARKYVEKEVEKRRKKDFDEIFGEWFEKRLEGHERVKLTIDLGQFEDYPSRYGKYESLAAFRVGNSIIGFFISAGGAWYALPRYAVLLIKDPKLEESLGDNYLKAGKIKGYFYSFGRAGVFSEFDYAEFMKQSLRIIDAKTEVTGGGMEVKLAYLKEGVEKLLKEVL